jgi:hypothetical protein
MPLGMLPALVGRLQGTGPQPGEPHIHPATSDIMRSVIARNDGVGLRDQFLRAGVVGR